MAVDRVRAVPPPEIDASPVARAFVVGDCASTTNARLAHALDGAGFVAGVVAPQALQVVVGAGDLVLNRVDVKHTLDGPCPGLWDCADVEGEGAVLLNRPTGMYLAHDKLATASSLHASGIPHPRTAYVPASGTIAVPFPPPYVLKPRFGSWGCDVHACGDERELGDTVRALGDRGWFRQDGALVQELATVERRDLRVVVAAGEVVGAVSRVAAPGEWRTNIALGGTRVACVPDLEVRRLALRAVAALGLDLAGVDVVRRPDGAPVVLEVNGAVDFTDDYALDGRDVHERAVRALAARYDELDPGAAVLARAGI